MPRVQFSKIEEGGRSLIPPGKYRMSVAEVKKRNTEKGDEMWTLVLSINDGEHAGRKVFDNITFSDAGYPRVKLVCSRLGLDVTADRNVEPEDLVGKAAFVTVETQTYLGKDQSKVPFEGYESLEGPSDSKDDDIPF